MPYLFSVFSVFFQHIVWYGPTSETAWMQRRQKNLLKYTDFIELKKIIRKNLLKLFELFFFSSPSHFVAVRFVSLKNIDS